MTRAGLDFSYGAGGWSVDVVDSADEAWFAEAWADHADETKRGGKA
jgi:hypothetical protein